MPDLVKLRNLAGQLREKREKARPRAARGGWYDIRNAVQDATPVYLYDMIGEDWYGDGINPMDFVNEISRISTPVIDLHISSEGGDVFDGLAIYEALKQHPSCVTVKVDSLAASAASFIAMSADPYDPATDRGGVRMARNARLMIHDAAMGGAYGAGTAEDMRQFAQAVEEMAALLDDISLNIADIYAQRAGGTAEQWRERMQAGVSNGGTWYSATAAKEIGLADAIIGEVQDDAAGGAAAGQTDNALDVGALVAAMERVFV